MKKVILTLAFVVALAGFALAPSASATTRHFKPCSCDPVQPKPSFDRPVVSIWDRQI